VEAFSLPIPDFRALFESAPGLYLVLLPDLRIVAASDAYLQATMTKREEILGRGLFDVFPDNPDDAEATGVRNLRASLNNVLETRRADAMAVQKYSVQRPAKDGGGFEERYWSPLNSPVFNAGGEVGYIIHRVEDVTEFIRLRQVGREREQAARALKSRADQMEAEIYERAQQVAEANRQLASLYRQIELLMVRADDVLSGGWEDEHMAIAPEEMLARVGQLLVDHSRLEDQLRQAQKMEAVGQLAGGVAHDFNNLLTVITGYTAMLLENSAVESVAPELGEIAVAANRAARLTHKLLAFSRKQVLQPRVINLNTVLTGMEEMLRRLIGEHITIAITLAGELGPVRADPNQIESVVMNLAVNARDAMPNGGRLEIETRNVPADARPHPLPAGDYVVLTVTDGGHGMDTQTAARIFEPFFTTKELGKGTGLGLATVHGIVEQSGGKITVESSPGAGAKFCVYLPVDEAPETPPTPQQAATSQPKRGGTVMVVEDEDALRKLVTSIVSAAGYQVTVASNGDEALSMAASKQIDLLLTDVVMPGVSGPELAARLRAKQEDLRVLYMSGYDRDLIQQEVLDGRATLLAKPFTPRGLLTRIDEVLKAKRNG
jgi:signal transduction histidine kinase/ActR/RegA family two-component response regulator